MSVSTCCASSWLVTVNKDGTRGALGSSPELPPDCELKWTCSTGLSARIPASIG
ncbi:MAG: hypothetical protein ACRDNF_02620 [Streptosporangiaceae bacterium]